MPTVSIITPLYNKAAYIAETIRSVLAQTYTDWDLWIVDNGSTDGGDRLIQQFEDPRIHLLRSPKQGPGAARNYGLQNAKGKWIQFLDADDLLQANHLARQLDVAQRHPTANLIVSYWQEFTDENPTTFVLKAPAGMSQPPTHLRESAIAFAPWAVHAALVQRSLLHPKPWPEELDQYPGEDIAFWFRVLQHSNVAYSDSQGALYRIQTVNCRTQNQNPSKWFTGIDAAIHTNQQYWQRLNRPWTAGHCEAMMRSYSQLYRLAHSHHATEIAHQALTQAQYWLQQYRAIAPQASFSMRLRSWIGLPLFLQWVKS
jgi:glycosyltransferase involved in cell wall biosynthesis